MKKVRTGYKNCTIYVKKTKRGYTLVSNDKAFMEYYMSYMFHDTYTKAVEELDALIVKHDLDRFSK